jgi:hypothetical protein
MRLRQMLFAAMLALATLAPGAAAQVPGKLGLKPEPAGKLKVRAEWKNKVPPKSPDKVDHFAGWKMNLGGNDKYGDCGPVSAANHLQMNRKFLLGQDSFIGLPPILDLYSRSTRPPFNPQTGANDNGVVMSDLLEAMRAGGLDGDRVVAYVSLADKSDASIQAAINEFGGVLFAVDLQTAQQRQTDQGYWDYQRSGQWGGHAILCGKYDRGTGRMSVATWGKEVFTTPNFRRYQLSEVWLPLWESSWKAGKYFADGLDTAQIAKDWEALGGAPLPKPPEPKPDPKPVDPGKFTGDVAVVVTFKDGVPTGAKLGGGAKADPAAVEAAVRAALEEKFPGVRAVGAVDWPTLIAAIVKAVIEALSKS